MVMNKQITQYEHKCNFCDTVQLTESPRPPETWFYFHSTGKTASNAGFPILLQSAFNEHGHGAPREIASLSYQSWCSRSCLINWLLREVESKANNELEVEDLLSMGD